MCGIVGYIGKSEAIPILVDGLARLEYRGYDSSGIAVYNDGVINIKKSKGRIEELRKLTNMPNKSTAGIGHTRWATHGKPCYKNSHPHTDENANFAIVHNGIIENFLDLKDRLIKNGHKFVSETDTEVVANLLDVLYDGNMLDCITKTTSMLSGSYALGILSKHSPDKIYATKKDSPLIIGISEDGNFLASDINAVIKYTNKVYYLNDGETAEITAEKVTIYDKGKNIIPLEICEINFDTTNAEKGNYDHYMMKEIMEQPKVVRNTINHHLSTGSITFDELKMTADQIKNIRKIFFVACGSAYHAGLAGKYITEKLSRIPVEVCVASEFRYTEPIIDNNTLVITISQSGETADTVAALREAKRLGAKTLSIVNVQGSTIARESDNVIYTQAGPEIAVATTKAYSAQLAVIYLLALYIAKIRGLEDITFNKYTNEITKLPDKISTVLNDIGKIKEAVKNNPHFANMFFIGRGLDYAVCMEGSLKLKEISYINSEAYPAGELKHGTISLIEDGSFVIASATQDKLLTKTLGNIEEVKTRGGKIMLITKTSNRNIDSEADYVFHIPNCDDLFTPSLTVVIFQLFSYYVALFRGCDIDKPRNLAKSVTVE